MSAARTLRGMRDFVPDQMIKRQRIISIFREIFELHGFEPIDTPALEYYATLTGQYGDDEKLIYHFEDHGRREVALRYDLTVPFARFVAQHENELVLPFKRYHIAPVWRADRPQRGRYREFWQCDADIVGADSMVADADVVSIIVDALNAVNIPNFAVHINHRKLLEAIAIYAGVDETTSRSVYRAIDKLDRIGVDGVVAELEASGVDSAAAGRVVELVALTGEPDRVLSSVAERLAGIELASDAIRDLSQLFDFLAAQGVSKDEYVFDLSLARGLSYYTGPVYEAITREADIGSLAGAGRYDNMVGMFMNRNLPATGIALGLERIIDVVDEFNLLDVPSSITEVLVTIFDEDTTPQSLALTGELRRAGLRVEVFLEPGQQLGRQFRFADRRGIPYVAVLGPSEVERDVVTIRNLATGAQQEYSRDSVAKHLLCELRREG